MNLNRAIEVFVEAFCRGKSQFHSYVPTYHSGLWVMRDGPDKRRDPRKIEVVNAELGPHEAVERLAQLGIGWHFLCAIDPAGADSDVTKAAYKALGYRALTTEWVYGHDLAAVEPFEADLSVRLVESPELLATIRQRAPQPRKFRPGCRMYAIWDDNGDIGWVTSVPVEPDAWVSDLYVRAEYRSRGFGRALMTKLLQDDKTLGVETSYLVASKAGSLLYPKIGYQQLGTLQMFCPAER